MLCLDRGINDMQTKIHEITRLRISKSLNDLIYANKHLLLL